MESSGTEWSEKLEGEYGLSRTIRERWGGVGWSGVEWSGVEWGGVEWSGVGWGGVELVIHEWSEASVVHSIWKRSSLGLGYTKRYKHR